MSPFRNGACSRARKVAGIALAAVLWSASAAAQTGEEEAGDAPVAAETATASEDDVWTLEALLEQARDNAAVFREHEAKISRAQWKQYRADWAWGPKLESTSLIAPVPADADPDQVAENVDEIADLQIGPYFRQELRVVLPVYTFDRISIAQDLAEIGVDVAKLRRKDAARDLEFQLKRAYYSLQLSRAFSELLSEGSELVKEKLEEMETARDFGEAEFDTEDLRKLEIFDAELDTRVLDNEKLGRISTAGIKYLADVEGDVSVKPLDTESEPAPLGTLKLYTDTAMKTRPEVLMLEEAVAASGLKTELEGSNFYPNVFVATELKYGVSTEEIALRPVCRRPDSDAECVDTEDLFARPYSDPFDTLSWTIGLGMRWKFDFWQLKGKYEEAQAQERQVLAQRERALGAIRLEVRKLWIDASQAREKVDIQARRLEAARRWRDQFGLTMQQGGADIEEGIEPLKAFFESRALYLQARYDYAVARAALAKGIGVRSLDAVPTSQMNADGDATSENTD